MQISTMLALCSTIGFLATLVQAAETIMRHSSQSDEIPTLNAVEKCPHCGTSSPFLPIKWAGRTRGTKFSQEKLWGAFCCNSCGGIVVAVTGHSQSENLLLNHPDRIFPDSPKAHEDIPEVARNFLQQAMDTLHAPDAAAVMAGSAVDAMLKAKGLDDGTLYVRIDKALSDGVLTQDMADWAHEVRLGSNRPRHADKDRPHVSAEEAKQSVEFAEALANFLFVLSARIRRGIEAAKSADR